MVSQNINDCLIEIEQLDEQLEEKIIENIQKTPKEISKYFFERTVDDFCKLELSNFEKKTFIKMIYSAYMIGFVIGKKIKK